MSARLRIGVLCEALANGFWNEMIIAVERAARRRNVDLYVLVGGALDVPDEAAVQANVCYELPDARHLDGLVVMPLGPHASAERLEEYVRRHPGLAVAGLTAILGNAPSVCVDNLSSMHRIVSHLIEAHGARRVAFVQGPKSNAEAELRYRGYRRALIGHGLEQSKELVFRGDFELASGARAARALCEAGTPFDAVVAANDTMALGVLAELGAHGVKVPEAALVVGFDDLPDGRWGAPSLTTIRQPYTELAEAALERVIAQLEGRQVPALEVLPGELALRRSCGCRAPVARVGGAAPARSSAGSRAESDAALGPSAPSGAERLPPGWRARLGARLEANLAGAERGFVEGLAELVHEAAQSGRELGDWQEVVSALRDAALPGALSREKRWRLLEELLLRARVSVGERAEQRQAAERRRSERLLYEAIATGSDLLASFSEAHLLASLAARLPRMQIASCYLALYEPDPRWPPPRARLVFAYRDGARVDAEGEVASLETRALLSRARQPGERKSFVVAPLFFGDQQLGLLLLELGPPQGGLYDWLREQVSVALAGARLASRAAEESAERERAERAASGQELSIARRIRAALEPPQPRVFGLELLARVVPGREISGGGYDVRPGEDGAWILLVDAARGGLEARLLTMLLSSSLAAVIAATPAASPGDALRALREVSLERLGEAAGGRVLVVRYEQRGRVRYAGSGGGILIRRARGGAIERITLARARARADEDGLVEGALVLEPGDVMLLYSCLHVELGAGVGSEARVDPVALAAASPGGAVERLARALESDAERVLASLLERCARAAHGSAASDLTLVVARQA